MGRLVPRGSKTAKQNRKRVRSRAAPRGTHTPALTIAELQKQLSDARTQQAATSEVLEIINSSDGELEPVFRAILKNAIQLCEAKFGNLLLIDGQTARWAAGVGTPPKLARHLQSPSFQPTPGSHLERVMRTREVSHSADDMTEPVVGASARLGGARSTLCVPMVRGKMLVGAIFMYRTEVQPFTDSQINLVRGFATQAVIAVQNARLFNETREVLERQTATSEVLQVISSSPGQLDPVFACILDSSRRICAAQLGALYLSEGDCFRLVAMQGTDPSLNDKLLGRVLRFAPNTVLGRLQKTKGVVQIADALSEPGFFETPAGFTGPLMAIHAGARTLLGVPMLKENELIGGILIYRQEVQPFTEKQIELVKSFASQAVIAIENTRLINETKQALERQTATSDILKVVASSTADVAPVFQKVLETATRLCGAEFGIINLASGEMIRQAEFYNLPSSYTEAWRDQPYRPHPESVMGAVARSKQTIYVDDIRTLPAYRDGSPAVVALADTAGARSYVGVPMLRDDELIGMISIYRQEVRPFTTAQIELIKNFASQAVIAIENFRLLNELRQRTQQLSRSLDDLRTTQDRLVQTEKLASLGQLTAGIAHEIKNPLNFVNNFSSLSGELIDELNQAVDSAVIDDRSRKEIGELAQMLKGNLEKVVQHGKRADSIVKNMLLHSREASTERRLAEVNRLVEESLNLAYHGARAEKAGFTITLKHDLDPEAGALDLYPQEMTRALLNVISNGFYAATKRKAEGNDEVFEPILSAATRNLGKAVEIRIRDNGTGIPPEVREKMFNPFFTTKPTGEGTGLGLSMTHDIIVKQHGGRIDVETELGTYTEFIITLPR